MNAVLVSAFELSYHEAYQLTGIYGSALEKYIASVKMGAAMTYLLDADVFITAFKSYVAFDIAPDFWDSLVLLVKAGRVQSIDRIK